MMMTIRSPHRPAPAEGLFCEGGTTDSAAVSHPRVPFGVRQRFLENFVTTFALAMPEAAEHHHRREREPEAA